MMIVRSELSRRRNTERITFEDDLRARAGLVVEIEQDVADGGALDRRDECGDSVCVVGRDRSDFGGVKIARAAELARFFLARKCEHSRHRRALFLEYN